MRTASASDRYTNTYQKAIADMTRGTPYLQQDADGELFDTLRIKFCLCMFA